MTNELPQNYLQYRADFVICEQIIKKNSTSFYKAFSKLPIEKAWSVYAIYAFCRIADDAIDNYKNPQLIIKLRQELDALIAGQVPDSPVWRALSAVFERYQLNEQAFYDMLSGQLLDAEFKQPESQAVLLDYCYYVAGSVGLMLLPILSEKSDALHEPAIALGQAMQLTNILRDIGEDYQANRIYLPNDLIQKYGIKNEFVDNEVSENLINLWEYEAEWADSLYETGLELIPMVDKDCRVALLAAIYYYREILAVIREKKYPLFQERCVVDNQRKFLLNKRILNFAEQVNRYA